MDRSFNDCVGYLEERFTELPDKRTGSNTFINMRDIALSAFSVFFTQCPSFLEHQKSMKTREGNNNANSLFHIEHIPTDNHIRNILDEVPPSEIFPVYNKLLSYLTESKKLEDFRDFDEKLLLPLDGVHSHSSKKISCENCSTKEHKDGSVTYQHSMVTASFVHPNKGEVIPLIPMFIEPQDGHEKQDCERAAIKRWLSTSGKTYADLGVILLGDDIYCCQPVIEQTLAQQFHFIFVCKPDSHKTLYEWVESLEKGGAVRKVSLTMGNHKKTQIWHCRYVNEVPLRDGKDVLNVNWCELIVTNKEGDILYKNAFTSDYTITDKNVFAIAKAGRTRWKTENEHNNTLKNHGYYLEHNYGHGKKYLASTLTTLILLTFLVHNILDLMDKNYGLLRSRFSRKAFFNQLRTLLIYLYFATWTALMEFMVTSTERAPKRRRRQDSG